MTRIFPGAGLLLAALVSPALAMPPPALLTPAMASPGLSPGPSPGAPATALMSADSPIHTRPQPTAPQFVARQSAAPQSAAPLATRAVARDSGTGQRLLLTATAPVRLTQAAQPVRLAQATPPAPGDQPPPAAISRNLALRLGSGQILRLTAPAANVFVADPKVAEVHPAGPSTLFVFGVGAGRTTIAALGTDGRLIGAYDVTVQPSEFSARSVAAEIAHLVPGGHVRVQAQPKGLLLTG
ncbi:MAG: pilus assembly protein N-terminal domain-containing protein, partial [Acetobacteraceae bacterium]